MRCLLILLLTLITNSAPAQGWDINLALGLSYARILPGAQSTKHTDNIRYSFGQPGICIGPELYLNLNEHNRVLFSYQLSENKTGIKFRAGRGADYHEFSYEQFQLHNFSVGYCHQRSIGHEKAVLGTLVKIGIANGTFVGSGYGGTGSGSSAGYLYIQQLNGNPVMLSFWMPNITAGLTLSPRFRWSPLMERITATASLTAGFKDIYTDYAKVQYTIYTDNGIDKGTAQYRGTPLFLQFLVSYRLYKRERDS